MFDDDGDPSKLDMDAEGSMWAANADAAMGPAPTGITRVGRLV
jgi:hypothetical protein